MLRNKNKAFSIFYFVFGLIFFSPAPAYSDCTNPAGVPGEIFYNADQNVPQVCAGSTWFPLGKLNPSAGGNGCSNPTGTEGQIFYNVDYHVPQYCDGDDWREMISIIGGSGGPLAGLSVISAGEDHNCVIKANGTLWCWGNNANGQLGDGTTVLKTSPVQVGTDTNWAKVDGGPDHTCAIKTNGTLWCWGDNGDGELGIGNTTTPQTSPVQVGTDTDWAEVDATGETAGNDPQDFTCARKTNGTIWCWGENTYGESGTGVTGADILSPAQAGTDTDWAVISGGGPFTCAVKTTSTLWCWGRDNDEQLGHGAGVLNQSSPVQVGTDTDWATVYAGSHHACALKTDSSLWCWGNAGGGRLGNGLTTPDVDTPVQIGTDTDWAMLALGQTFSCALKANGTLWCWGTDGAGQLGNGPASTADVLTPTQTGTDTDWSSVHASDGRGSLSHVCALKTDNTPWCWGWDVGTENPAPVAN
jgi:alpha-tubulin suppressor-like RCC1 family protein